MSVSGKPCSAGTSVNAPHTPQVSIVISAKPNQPTRFIGRAETASIEADMVCSLALEHRCRKRGAKPETSQLEADARRHGATPCGVAVGRIGAPEVGAV